MAELQKNIRKPGGDLVSARSPFTRRVLLPTEADLCNLLGLTEEEYFQFLEGVAAKVRERPEAYNLVPNLVNGPLIVPVTAATTAAGTAGTLTLFGQIAVGIALSVVSYLLTPKPPSMKQGTSERTADIAGLKRFAPQSSFNTVQELATLGALIPLIFTNRDQNSNGGIRVNSQLMWSQLVSLGTYQQLKILALFSLGEIERRPDFEGYAIGDLLISNYHAKKIYKLNYSNDNYPPIGENIPFLRDGGIIPNDIFKVDDKRYFSGTRNPTTQATFGLSNPMPNMTYYKLPYELVRTPSDTDTNEGRPAGRITFKKRRKLLGSWPMRAGFINGGNASQKEGNSDLTKGTVIEYQILGSGDLDENLYEGIGYQQDIDTKRLTMEPHGLDDVNAAIKTIRENIDSSITEDEQYMAGTTLVNCHQINESDQKWSGVPWDGTFTRHYYFEVIEEGRYHASPSGRLDGNHTSNPNWDTNGKFFTVRPSRLDRDDHFYYEQNYNELYEPHIRYALQKATIGTISNNRRCDITEIGIKSKVFKEISFANVNSKPEEDKIYEVYDDRSTLTLGNINKYITRFSFFKLQVKINDVWTWLQPDITSEPNHSGLFCIKGNTPEFQYNYIRIDHLKNQYEFRFFPWPGNDVIQEVIARENNPVKYRVCLLNANKATNVGDLEQFSSNDFTVKFAGKRNYALTKSILSNSEWNLGHPSKNLVAVSSRTVTGFNIDHAANYDNPSSSNLPSSYPIVERWTKASVNGYPGFEGPYHDTIIVRFDNYPSPGRVTWNLYINPSDVSPNIQGFNGPVWNQSIETSSTSTSGVEFHYTKTDGFGGKFQPVALVFSKPNWYSVKKTEQYGTVATPVINLTNLAVTQKNNTSDIGDSDAAGLKVNLTVWTNLPDKDRWYAVWDLSDPGEYYTNGDKVTIPAQSYGGSVVFPGQEILLTVKSDEKIYSDDDIEHELNIYDAAADFWKYEGDRSSHLDGPEHQLVYINEIVKTEGVDEATYENLAYAGLRVNSSKEWTNFSQFSAYFKKGIKVQDIVQGKDNQGNWVGGLRATSLFPEIAYALLTDEKLGAGAVINVDSVNEANMTVAANFCKANNLFWDGVVSNKVNLREFIFEQGMYCLLDFTIVGGQFSLYPSVPFNYDPVTGEGDFKIKNDKDVVIKAMFTDGNIKDLQVAFLAPEDRQTFKANVLYRNEKENGFSENESKIIRLHGTEYNDDPLETYDLTGFCTSMDHAVTFGKYVLATRKFVDHTITFKTAPHYINGVQPGDYIRVFSTTQHVQRFNNGAILDDGTVVSKDTISGSKTFYYWNPSEQVVKEATVDFSNTNAVKAFAGSLFTIQESEASDQCYKVESITFGEDGLIELSGSYAELDGGKLAMLQKWDDTDIDNPLFDVE